jgi:hypothetical protein
MKCQEVSPALEEYFDGELDERQTSAIGAHLGACATCAARYAELAREQEFLLRYERDVEVTPQLWHGVAARIAAENVEPQTSHAPLGARLRTWLAATFTVPRFSPALTAALVLFAIALTVGVMKFTNKGARQIATTTGASQPAPPAVKPEQNEAPPAPQATITSPTPEQREQVIPVQDKDARPRQDENKKRSAPRVEKPLMQTGEPHIQLANATNDERPQQQPTDAADALVRDAEAKYQKAIAILTRDVNARRSTLDAATLARYDDTLKALDRTIAETKRAAMGRGHNDPVAVQYMLTAYEKKVEVLREMARN